MKELKEEWKDIKGYEGLYRISNFGNVYSVKRNSIKKATLNKNKQGHISLRVTLCKNSSVSVHQLSRLVYKTFKYEIKGMIDFKDNDYKNCHIDNLIDVNKTFKFKKYHCSKVLNKKTMKIYDSISALAKEINKSSTTVFYGIKRGSKKYSNYKIID